MMNKIIQYRTQLIIAYSLVFLTVIPGVLFKIMHWPYANILLIFGMVLLIPLFVLTLYDMIVRPGTKALWCIGMFLSPALVGLIYIIKRTDSVETK